MRFLLSYNSKTSTHAMGVLSSYSNFKKLKIMFTKKLMISLMLACILILTARIFFNIGIGDIGQLDDFLTGTALDDSLDYISDS